MKHIFTPLNEIFPPFKSERIFYLFLIRLCVLESLDEDICNMNYNLKGEETINENYQLFLKQKIL